MAAGVEIIARPSPYPLRGLYDNLAPFQQDALFFADHWLAIDWSTGDAAEPSELVDIFLLALWLARPTKTQVKYRFCVATDPKASPDSITLLFDQFQSIEDIAAEEVTTADLTAASSYFPLLLDVYVNQLRLANALYLTLAGCEAIRWQVAFVCYAAAAEAILTYETGSGITRRLSLAYACLLESTTPGRDRAFREFQDLYNKRSDIIHGRGHSMPEPQRLPTLARFGNALRALWKTVIASSTIKRELEASDASRMVFFQSLQSGYSSPKA